MHFEHKDYDIDIQRSAKVFVCGCKKFVPALAYLFCLSLPGSCLARFAYFLADLCVLDFSMNVFMGLVTWDSGALVESSL